MKMGVTRAGSEIRDLSCALAGYVKEALDHQPKIAEDILDAVNDLEQDNILLTACLYTLMDHYDIKEIEVPIESFDTLRGMIEGMLRGRQPTLELVSDPEDKHKFVFRKARRSRWKILDKTTPSGKRMFQCTQCGRESITPDKTCREGCKEK